MYVEWTSCRIQEAATQLGMHVIESYTSLLYSHRHRSDRQMLDRSRLTSPILNLFLSQLLPHHDFVLKMESQHLAARVDSYKKKDKSVRIKPPKFEPDADGDELTVGVQSVRVSVRQGTGGSERSGSRVTVAVVLSAGAVDGGSMGLLVKDSSSLVLSVALARESRKLVEEERAVGDVVVGGQGVGENVGLAATVNVSAVGAGLSSSGRSAVAGNCAQTGSDGAAGGGRGGLKERLMSVVSSRHTRSKVIYLEVCLECGCGARSGGGGSGSGQSVAVGEGSTDGRQLGARAVTLDRSALGERLEGSLDLGSLLRVDVDGEVVALVREDRAREGS